MVSEAKMEQTDHGLVPNGEGWFVLNARETQWRAGPERPAICSFENEPEFEQYGFHINVLGPGEAMAMYHWEADQEDFLVLSGEAILIIEGQERPLRAWDFVHCPPNTNHVIVGAGTGPSVIIAVGARQNTRGDNWGGYHVDEAAKRHNASAEEETTDPEKAYARFERRQPTRFREEWMPS